MGERTRAATRLPGGLLKTTDVFPFDESVFAFHESVEIKTAMLLVSAILRLLRKSGGKVKYTRFPEFHH